MVIKCWILRKISAMQLTIILTASAVLLTSFIAWILHKASLARGLATLQSRVQLLELSNDQVLKEKLKAIDEKDQFRDRASRAETRASELEKHFLEKIQSQKQDLEQIGEKFRAEFKNLAQGILEDKSQKFTLQNEAQIKAILDPLKNQLGEFKQKVEQTY